MTTAASSSDEQRYIVPGLERGLRLLGEFSQRDRELTPPELARRLGVPRTTVFRMLVTLEQMGFVQRSADGRSYRLGVAVLRLGFEYLASLGMVELGRPLLDKLRDDTGHTASLVQRDRRDVVYLHRAPTRSLFATNVTVGTRMPAHATVLGHVLLGDLSLGELQVLYPEAALPAMSSHTPKDIKALHAAVQQARERGWVCAQGYYEAHISTVAAPVRDDSGRIVAAIGLTIPGTQIAPAEQEAAVRQVAAAAMELSRLLNHRDHHGGGAAPR
jgi:DNA-binding IclR family transcriptional regulator